MNYNEKLTRWNIGRAEELPKQLDRSLQLIRECAKEQLEKDEIGNSVARSWLRDDDLYSRLFRLHLQENPADSLAWYGVVCCGGFGRFCQLVLLGNGFSRMELCLRQQLQPAPKSNLDKILGRFLLFCRYLIDQPRLLARIPGSLASLENCGWIDLVLDHEPVDYYPTWPSYVALHDAAVLASPKPVVARTEQLKNSSQSRKGAEVKGFTRGDFSTILAKHGTCLSPEYEQYLLNTFVSCINVGTEVAAKTMLNLKPNILGNCPGCGRNDQFVVISEPQPKTWTVRVHCRCGVDGPRYHYRDLKEQQEFIRTRGVGYRYNWVCQAIWVWEDRKEQTPRKPVTSSEGDLQFDENGNFKMVNGIEKVRQDLVDNLLGKKPLNQQLFDILLDKVYKLNWPSAFAVASEEAKQLKKLAMDSGVAVMVQPNYSEAEARLGKELGIPDSAHLAGLYSKEQVLKCYAPNDAAVSGKMWTGDSLGHRFEQIAELLFRDPDHRLQDRPGKCRWTLRSLLSEKSATGPDRHTLEFELYNLDPCEQRGPESKGIGCGMCGVVATLDYRDGVLRYSWKCLKDGCSAAGEERRFLKIELPVKCSPYALVNFFALTLIRKIGKLR